MLYTGGKSPFFAPTGSQSQILHNLHCGSSTGHGVLEHSADVLCSLVLRQLGNIHTVNDNIAAVNRIYACDHIEHS